MKRFFLIFALFCLGSQNLLKAQWEYTYFVFRAGLNHSIMTEQPQTVSGRLIFSDAGTLYPLFTYKDLNLNRPFDYSLAGTADLQLHFDFQNNNSGIIVAMQYANAAVNARYFTENGEYEIEETFRATALGIPVYFKYGKRFYDNQRYLFTGFQYNINQNVYQVQRVNWSSELFRTKLEDAHFVEHNLSYIIGFNYIVFNAELNVMLSPFLNKHYKNESQLYIYRNQPNLVYFVKTGLTVPITPWIEKNYWVAKLIRKFRIF